MRTMTVLLLLTGAGCRPQPEPQPAPGETANGAAPTATAPASATASVGPPPPAPGARVFGFDADGVDAPPAGFSFGRTGGGAVGRWVVRKDPSAPSAPNVLAQLDADDTDMRFPLAVPSEPSLRDVRVRVRCKMLSGKVDQACGLVARYRDENNYFITRANALENNIRLYTVRDGTRRQLASWSGTVAPNVWHDYQLTVRGDHLEVHWNGQRVLDHHDATFEEAGKVGLWTKADSVSYFDDLTLEAL